MKHLIMKRYLVRHELFFW